MKNISPATTFFIQLAKTQALLSYRFDRALGGLGFTEFLILLALEEAPEKELSRIALAQEIGFTASGITRLLLPMAKVHLVTAGASTGDARVKMVKATTAGRQKLHEEMKRLEFVTDEILPEGTKREAETFTKHLREISSRAGTR